MEALRMAADVAGWFLIGLALLIGAEALRLLAGWKVDETVAALRRRLADVEALRRAELHPVPGVYSPDQGCRVPPAGWECTRDPGHDGPCAAVPSMVRAHLGDPPYSRRPVCDETEGDCS